MFIDFGKVLDVELFSKVCKQCQFYFYLDKDSEEYRRWRVEYNNCKVNYKGFVLVMEVEGVDCIFRCLVVIYKF